MALKQKGGEMESDPKKRKRVGFAAVDTGVEPNECIKIYLVKSQDEVGTESGLCIDPIDLNRFFGEEGKIYGYNHLKIRIWLSTISFHAYADIAYESTYDGGKGITDLKPALQNIFGESLLEKEEFLHTFSTETHCVRTIISEGKPVPLESSGVLESVADSKEPSTSIVRMDLHKMPVGLLYSRLLPLVLLLVEGSTTIDVTDPQWEIYFVTKRIPDISGNYFVQLLGFATVYRFYHYPDSTRRRISQILVLPSYQGQGYGRRLLEAVNYVAVSENVYDVTIEEPSDYLQYIRACIDTLRLLEFPLIEPAVDSVVSYLKEGNLSKRVSKFRFRPSGSIVDSVREKLKINKKQFLKCWEILIYLNLDSEDHNCLKNFRSCLSDRVRSEILEKDDENHGKRLVEVPNDYGHDLTFVVFRSHDNSAEVKGLEGKLDVDPKTQEQQLNELVDKEMEDIVETAMKVSLLRKPLNS